MHVEGVELPEGDQLLQSLVDEDDADEGGEGFFGEAGDVADQRAGVGGDQQQAEEGGPESDTGPQGQVGQAVLTEDRRKKYTAVFLTGLTRLTLLKIIFKIIKFLDFHSSARCDLKLVFRHSQCLWKQHFILWSYSCKQNDFILTL